MSPLGDAGLVTRDVFTSPKGEVKKAGRGKEKGTLLALRPRLLAKFRVGEG